MLLEEARLDLESVHPALGVSVSEALLAVHRSYFEPLWPLVQARRLQALAHITGGGFLENIPRVLPDGCQVEIVRSAWEVPAIFRLIQELGHVSDAEMARVFNLGIGMVAIVRPADAAAFASRCPEAVRLGSVTGGERSVLLRN